MCPWDSSRESLDNDWKSEKLIQDNFSFSAVLDQTYFLAVSDSNRTLGVAGACAALLSHQHGDL